VAILINIFIKCCNWTVFNRIL